MQRVAYGPAAEQYAELYRAASQRVPGVAVVIHGGFWRARYDASLGRPLCADLAARGITAYNVEYRRVGAGGGWPDTFDDVAAAVRALDALDVDTSAVIAIGHSAGGCLAAWVAASVHTVTGVVAQAGVLDLGTAARSRVGGRAVPDLLGGMPDEVPGRYALADPIARLPLRAPVICVHAPADDSVPIAQSERYVAAAEAAGGSARLVPAAGDHYTVIDPASPDWALCVAGYQELAALS